jgi:CHASE2 domain-containing sensor protein
MVIKTLDSFSLQLPSLKTLVVSFQRLIGPVLATSLTMTALIWGIRQIGLIQGAELSAYDQFVQKSADEGEDKRLLVVGVTEGDLEALQEWPLGDLTLAKALRNLHAYSPKAIGIDILRDIPIGPGRKELLNQLNSKKNTIVVCKVSSDNDLGTAPPKNLANDQIGFADLVIDPGGTLRRSLLMVSPPEPKSLARIRKTKHSCSNPKLTLFSLGFNAALQYLQQKGIAVSMTKDQQLLIGSTLLPRFHSHMGGYRGADDGGYQLLLRYRSENNAVKQVSLVDLLNDRVTGDLIRDRIVFIGYTTPLAKDDFYTPYSSNKRDLQKMPGVVVHAQSASQILSAVLDGRRLIWTWPDGAELAWIFGCSLVGGIIGWYVRHPAGFGIVTVGVSGMIYGFSLLIFFQGGWIPVVPAIAAFIATSVGVVLFDRFNNSAYGQAVYQKVKTLLHLEVEIDEEKLEKQVAEITETDYFKDLQSSVKDLRAQQFEPQQTQEVNSQSKVMNDSLILNESHPEVKSKDEMATMYQPQASLDFIDNSTRFLVSESESESVSSTDYEEDYYSQLKKESQDFRPLPISEVTPMKSGQISISHDLKLDDVEFNQVDHDDEYDFLSGIKAEGNRLKNTQSDV